MSDIISIRLPKVFDDAHSYETLPDIPWAAFTGTQGRAVEVLDHEHRYAGVLLYVPYGDTRLAELIELARRS